jgi:hypothetical protein
MALYSNCRHVANSAPQMPPVMHPFVQQLVMDSETEMLSLPTQKGVTVPDPDCSGPPVPLRTGEITASDSYFGRLVYNRWGAFWVRFDAAIRLSHIVPVTHAHGL